MTTAEVITEAQLTQTIIEMARAFGFLVYHTGDSRRNEPGVPDLLMVSQPPMRPRVIFLEIKSAVGKLRPGRVSPRTGRYLPGQEDWLAALRRCNVIGPTSEGSRVEVYLVRPGDMDDVVALLGEKPGLSQFIAPVPIGKKGRPTLDIPLADIQVAVREHSGNLSRAARELGCSRDYVRGRLRDNE